MLKVLLILKNVVQDLRWHGLVIVVVVAVEVVVVAVIVLVVVRVVKQLSR